MNIKDIKTYFNDIEIPKRYSEFSVFIPLVELNDEVYVLFEKRAHTLKSQPGEICFPGGRKEDGEHPRESAVRETMEELRLKEKDVTIIKNLGYYMTPFNYKINIYLGTLDVSHEDLTTYNIDEVDSIFMIPLRGLINCAPKKHMITVEMKPENTFPYHKIEGGKKYDFKTGYYPVWFYDYKNYTIWGITAQILKIFLDNIKELS